MEMLLELLYIPWVLSISGVQWQLWSLSPSSPWFCSDPLPTPHIQPMLEALLEAYSLGQVSSLSLNTRIET